MQAHELFNQVISNHVGGCYPEHIGFNQRKRYTDGIGRKATRHRNKSVTKRTSRGLISRADRNLGGSDRGLAKDATKGVTRETSRGLNNRAR